MPVRLMRILTLALVWAALLFGAAQFATFAASPDEAQEVTRLINVEREARGLPPLTLDPLLSNAAQGHSDDLATHNIFSHTGSDGRDFWQRVLDNGYPASFGGEAVAAGYGSPAEVVRGWMGSPPHQHILLLPEVTQIGVGHARRGGTTYVNYWTVDLAVPSAEYAAGGS